MPHLRRKVFQIEIRADTIKLPERIKTTLQVLNKEKYLAIKGGFAKYFLGEKLKTQGKIERNRAIENSWGESDLDLVLTFVGSRKKAIPQLSQRVKDLKDKLKTVEIQLNPVDIEITRGNFKDEKIIQRFLESQDLTINEILLVSKGKGNIWTLYYTNKCYRDTIISAGILSANGKGGTTRFDYGRQIAGPRGIARLIRFLVEGKVRKIYLPRWWIKRNEEEAERLKKEILGGYGLILCERYSEKPELQARLMRALNSLEITNIQGFKKYRKEQKFLFEIQRKGEKFHFDNNRSFEEIQKKRTKKKEEGKNSQQERKKTRKECSHKKTKMFKCSYCEKECKITKCIDCTTISVIPKGCLTSQPLNRILCNYNFANASVHWDQKGFFFPPRIKYPKRKNV